MKKLYVLWGTKVGDPVWAEQVIIESRQPINLEKARAWGEDNGYTNMRILETFDGDVPRFS